MTFDFFMHAIAPIIVGVLMILFRRPFTEQIVREQTAFWRDWRWGAKNRSFVSNLVNTGGVTLIVFGLLYIAQHFGIWRP